MAGTKSQIDTTGFETCRHEGMTWRLRPEYRFLLAVMPFSSDVAKASWKLAKKYPIKRVFEADGNDIRRLAGKEAIGAPTDAGYILKIYRPASRWTQLTSIVRSSKAEKEFDISLEAHRRGIPTVLPLAVGVRRKRGLVEESFVVFPRMPACVGLDEFLKGTHTVQMPGSPASFRRQVIAHYGEFAREVHDAGLYQDDFDPNNILLSWEDGQIRLRLVDFERAKLGAPLSLRKRVWLLAKLNRFPYARATERMRFLAAYCSRPAADQALFEPKTLARLVLRKAEDVLGRDLRRAAKNCCEENRNTGFFESAALRGFYRKRFPAASGITRDQAIALAEAALGLPPAREVISADGATQDVLPTTPTISCEAQIFRGADREKRAFALWKVSNALLRVGIPVQPPLLVAIEKKRSSTVPARDREAVVGERSAIVLFRFAEPVREGETLEAEARISERKARLLRDIERAFTAWGRGRPPEWRLPRPPLSPTAFVLVAGTTASAFAEEGDGGLRLALRGTALRIGDG